METGRTQGSPSRHHGGPLPGRRTSGRIHGYDARLSAIRHAFSAAARQEPKPEPTCVACGCLQTVNPGTRSTCEYLL